MQSLNDLVVSIHWRSTQKVLLFHKDRVWRGYEPILSICRGTEFKFKDFEVKFDPKEAQWSPECSLWSIDTSGRCKSCAEISRMNLLLLQAHYDAIKDFSKITFHDGFIDIKDALGEQKEEKKPIAPKDTINQYTYSYADELTAYKKYSEMKIKSGSWAKI